MKATVTIATLAFWAAVAGLNLIAAGEPVAAPPARPPASAPQPGGATEVPVDAQARFTLADVARHADSKRCWMAIDGVVYDFTGYLPQHPADPAAMLRHCGKDASEAFRTKDAGRPHSPYAAQLLPKYRVGVLAR